MHERSRLSLEAIFKITVWGNSASLLIVLAGGREAWNLQKSSNDAES